MLSVENKQIRNAKRGHVDPNLHLSVQCMILESTCIYLTSAAIKQVYCLETTELNLEQEFIEFQSFFTCENSQQNLQLAERISEQPKNKLLLFAYAYDTSTRQLH